MISRAMFTISLVSFALVTISRALFTMSLVSFALVMISRALFTISLVWLADRINEQRQNFIMVATGIRTGPNEETGV